MISSSRMKRGDACRLLLQFWNHTIDMIRDEISVDCPDDDKEMPQVYLAYGSLSHPIFKPKPDVHHMYA
jgi:hypothetical protein